MPTLSPQPVLTALTEQVACYHRLAKLAAQQHEFVQNSQIDSLLEVLQQRQAVLDKLGALEAIIRPAKQAWPQYLLTLPETERGNAGHLLHEARRLLEEITTADKLDALVLQQRKLSLGQQIQRAGTARQLNRNYAASAYGGAGNSKLDVRR